MRNYLKLVRPEQYIKNGFVLAPLFFGGSFFDIPVLTNAILAFCCFCLAASSIYILNDYYDINEDRSHPEKSKRPLAAGSVSVNHAIVLLFLLLSAAFAVAYWLSIKLCIILLVYVFLNYLYSRWLKHIAILDINIIAVGFVLRLLAGAAVTAIVPSIWILLITYLLALFLALAKRRTDVLLAQTGLEVRKNIKGYNLIFIDIVLGLLASILIVCYIFYCISPEIQQHYHSEWLYLSIIFVVNGILRYLKLALVDQATYSPTLVVLKDRFIQITLVCWIALMCYLLYFKN